MEVEMGTASRSALQDIRVLDFTRLLPGAFASQMLADLGADVVKIERPDGGDPNRVLPPLARTESGSFLLLNRNKRSLTLDLKTEKGKEIVRGLVVKADIVLEGFRPGVMARLGLSYEAHSDINPRLIYCAISGYGQDGPSALAPGHDLNFMAETGALQLYGGAEAPARVPGLPIGDIGGGSLMATTGVMAALFARERSGRGQMIDVSMFDGAMSWLAYQAPYRLFGGIEPRSEEQPLIGQAPCYNVYRCSDGRDVALGLVEEHFWHRFCDRLGLPLLKPRQWPVGQETVEQKALLARLFASDTRDNWVKRLAPLDIPFGPVLSIGEALASPQASHREMVTTVSHPVEGTIPQLGFPVKYSGTPCTIRMPPPLLGEHSDILLAEIGYDDAAISALRADGVVGPRPDGATR